MGLAIRYNIFIYIQAFQAELKLLSNFSSQAQAWMIKARQAIKPSSSLTYKFQAKLKPC